jgi:hypothetical protein
VRTAIHRNVSMGRIQVEECGPLRRLQNLERQTTGIVPWNTAQDAQRFRVDGLGAVIYLGCLARRSQRQLEPRQVLAKVAARFAFLAQRLPVAREIRMTGRIAWGRLWTYGRLTINLREVIHDTSASITSVQGNGVQTFYDTKSGVIPITNLDIGYDVLKSVNLSVGAVNLFNRYPDRVPQGLLTYYGNLGQAFGATQYAGSPIGVDGGYYYLKATYTF